MHIKPPQKLRWRNIKLSLSSFHFVHFITIHVLLIREHHEAIDAAIRHYNFVNYPCKANSYCHPWYTHPKISRIMLRAHFTLNYHDFRARKNFHHSLNFAASAMNIFSSEWRITTLTTTASGAYFVFMPCFD